MRIQRGGQALRLAAGTAAIMIAAAACGSNSSATPGASPTAGPASTPVASPAASSGASPSAGGQIDLFNTAYAPAQGTDGGTAILGDWQEATQFNPYYLTQVTEANVASAVWSTLVVFTDDYKYAPDLATQVPTLDNGGVKVPGDNGDAMTVTWTLRDGLKWSDGQDLTCDDFKYAWEWVLSPDNVGVVTSGFDDVTAWDCPSATEMVLHFKNVFEGYITMVVAPLPRHYLSKIPIKDQVNGAGFRPDEIAKLPTSGAFKFESVTPASEVRLARNPNYTSWKTGLPAHLDSLVFKWYGDPDAMIAGFRGGEVDVATDLQDLDIPKVQDLGDQVSAIPSLTYEYLRPNWSDVDAVDTKQGVGGCSKNPAVADRGNGCPMADPAMRQALAYAIDKNEINARLLSGQAQVANTFVSPDAWFYVDQQPTSYDPEKAKQILEAAGWTDTDGDGIREKNGLKAKIELCTSTRQVRQDTLALIAGMAQGRRDRLRHQPGRRDLAVRRLQRVDRRHPVRAVPRQLRRGGARDELVHRPARQLLQLPQQPVQPARRQQRQRQRPGHRRRPRPGPQQRRLRDDQVGDGRPAEAVRGEGRRGPALLPQAGGPARAAPGQLLRQPDAGRPDVERRGLVRRAVRPHRQPVRPAGPRTGDAPRLPRWHRQG